jgi:hypothetical protein
VEFWAFEKGLEGTIALKMDPFLPFDQDEESP